jgi:hypothetical protein
MGSAYSTCGRNVKFHAKLKSEILKGYRPFRRPRRRWENNIRMDLKEIYWRARRLV